MIILVVGVVMVIMIVWGRVVGIIVIVGSKSDRFLFSPARNQGSYVGGWPAGVPRFLPAE